jgi:uncharacterized protein (DUF983 family)
MARAGRSGVRQRRGVVIRPVPRGTTRVSGSLDSADADDAAEERHVLVVHPWQHPMSQSQQPSKPQGALLLFARGLLLRCPVCGGGGLFENWFKIRPQCPTCRYVFARGESGYQLGSMALDLIIPLVSWFFLFFGILIGTWPNPPWTLLQWGSVAYMILLPLLLYPVSHTLAIALDILVRPPGSH